MPRINHTLTARRDAVLRMIDAGWESARKGEYRKREGFCGVSFDGRLEWTVETDPVTGERTWIDMFDYVFYVPEHIQFNTNASQPPILKQTDCFISRRLD